MCEQIHIFLGNGLYDYNPDHVAVLKQRRKEYVALQAVDKKYYLKFERACTMFIQWLEGENKLLAREWPKELRPYIYVEMSAYALLW